MSALLDFIKAHGRIYYNEELKNEFKTKSLKHLKGVVKEMNPIESNVWFNAGGIAVSGDANLMMMLTPTQGIHMFFNLDFSPTVVCRTIKHMKDYSGGNNNSKPFAILDSTAKTIDALQSIMG